MDLCHPEQPHVATAHLRRREVGRQRGGRGHQEQLAAGEDRHAEHERGEALAERHAAHPERVEQRAERQHAQRRVMLGSARHDVLEQHDHQRIGRHDEAVLALGHAEILLGVHRQPRHHDGRGHRRQDVDAAKGHEGQITQDRPVATIGLGCLGAVMPPGEGFPHDEQDQDEEGEIGGRASQERVGVRHAAEEPADHGTDGDAQVGDHTCTGTNRRCSAGVRSSAKAPARRSGSIMSAIIASAPTR